MGGLRALNVFLIEAERGWRAIGRAPCLCGAYHTILLYGYLLFAVIALLRAGAQLKCIGCCVPAPCDVEHCKLAARGLLSFLSFLRAFLLNVVKAQSKRTSGCGSARVRLRPGPSERRDPCLEFGILGVIKLARHREQCHSQSHQPSSRSTGTGAKPPNPVKQHGYKSCKKCADMGLALIQYCPGVPC